MRLVEFSVQEHHIHLLVEARHRRALARGLQGLAIRVAKGVNRLSGRHGKVFADRYHARILKTLAEVRNAVEYVRRNWHKHQNEYGRWSHPWYVDPYSSMSGEACCYMDQPVVARPMTWLLRRAAPPP
jgi:hypothetical protein